MIDLQGVTKTYPNGVCALDGVDLHIEKGEFVFVVGHSGAGKSTLIKTLLREEVPTEGEVTVNGRDLIHMKQREIPYFRRTIGVVFQDFRLIPTMTVFDNVAFALQVTGVPRRFIRRRVPYILNLLGLDDKYKHYPPELSGGEQQRVALARALVIEPSVLLFDEPLSNLDAKLRVSMRTEIRRIQQEVGITAIYVTHDQSEAMALSDNIIIMKNGVVEQMGTPQEIYYHPVNEFVADFIGEANFLKGVMTGHNGTHATLNIEGHEMAVAGRDDLKEGETYTVVLRPESGHLADEGGLPCKVIVSCFMGSYQNYHVMVGDTLVKLAEHNPKNKRIYQVGEACRLVFDPEEVHVL